MKFEAFVKKIGTKGVVYVRDNRDKWLCHNGVYAKIPPNINNVSFLREYPMPDWLNDVLMHDSFTDPCVLTDAIMTEPDGKINDVLRVYTPESKVGSIYISQFGYSFLDAKLDLTEIYHCSGGQQVMIIKNKPIDGGDTVTVAVINEEIIDA